MHWRAAAAAAVTIASGGCAGVPAPLDYICETALEDGPIIAQSRIKVNPTTGLVSAKGAWNEWAWRGPGWPNPPSASISQYLPGMSDEAPGRVGFSISVPDKPRTKVARIELRSPTAADAASLWDEPSSPLTTHFTLQVDASALAPLINSRQPFWLALVGRDGSVIQALPVDLGAVTRGRALWKKAEADSRADAANFQDKCGQEIIVT